MKATALLRRDHRAVAELFQRYEEAGERAHVTRGELVQQVRQSLDVHTRIEEEIFYPAVEQQSGAKDLVREAREEHRLVDALLDELAGMTAEDGQFDAKVTVLRENVEHHVQEEEDEMLPRAEREMSAERLEQLGAEMEARRQALLEGTATRLIRTVRSLLFGGEEAAKGDASAVAGERHGDGAKTGVRARGPRTGKGAAKGAARKDAGQPPKTRRRTPKRAETGRSGGESRGTRAKARATTAAKARAKSRAKGRGKAASRRSRARSA